MYHFLSSLHKFEVDSKRLLSLSFLGVRPLDERTDLGTFIACVGVEMCSSFEVDRTGSKEVEGTGSKEVDGTGSKEVDGT